MGKLTRTQDGLVHEVLLTNAQMLLTFTAPIVLVPAMAGRIWVPTMIDIVSTIATAYATVANFFLGVTGALSQWATVSLANSALNNVATNYSIHAVDPTGHGVTSALADLPLVFSANANPTGGNAENSVLLKVFYVELQSTPIL